MSANPFAALDMEDDEPVVQVGKTTKAKETKPEAAKAVKPAEKAVAKPVAAPVKAAPAAAAVEERGANPTRVRRGGKPAAGAGRGKDQHRDGWSGRGREFDRHESGTGRGKEVAKGGAGAHNWGADKDAAKDVGAEATPETAAPVEGAEATEAVAEEVAPVEEPDNTLTFEEYQAQKASKRSGDLFQTVKVDTAGLMKQFDGIKLKKKEDEQDELSALIGAGKTAKAAASSQQAGEKAFDASLLGFKIANAAEAKPERAERTDRPTRGGRGGRGGATTRPARSPRAEGEESAPAPASSPRGGRGGARGARGGAAPRGGAAASGPKSRVNVSSTSDFPSL